MTNKYVTFKIDGEFLTHFFRKLYYADDLPYDEVKDKFKDSLNLQGNELNEVFYNLIYGKRKLVGINEFDFVEDIDFDVYNYSRFSKPTFEEGKGIRGILTQDGIFVSCEYGGHFGAIDWIGEKSFGGIIFYLHDYDSDICGVASDCDTIPLTKMQTEWLKDNKRYMNDKQIKQVEGILWLNKGDTAK